MLLVALAALSGCGGEDEQRAGGPSLFDASRDSGARVQIADAMMAADRSTPDIVLPDGDGIAAPSPDGDVVGAPSPQILSGVGKPSRAKRSQAMAACGGSEAPVSSNTTAPATTILCLVNAERTSRGLKALKRNRRLDRAALAHSRDMVRRRYFAHNSPSGTTPLQRIRRARYVPRGRAFVVGENLAFGSGQLSTPRVILQSWLDSPAHRANLLDPDYRELGIGIAPGTPTRGPGAGATFTTAYGVIR